MRSELDREADLTYVCINRMLETNARSQPLPASPPASTKERILDAATRLFAAHGFEGTSLRMITAEAGTNLAAVNYHFQSKESLFSAVYGRFAGPVNRRRMELLDQFEKQAAGRPLELEKILEAFLIPAFELSDRQVHASRLMVRLQYFESREMFRQIVESHFHSVLIRFRDALSRALPHLAEQELCWRWQFFLGSFAHVIAESKALDVAGLLPLDSASRHTVIRRLIQFGAAGLRAPATEVA